MLSFCVASERHWRGLEGDGGIFPWGRRGVCGVLVAHGGVTKLMYLCNFFNQELSFRNKRVLDDAAAIQNLRGSPRQPDPSKPGMHIPITVNFDNFAGMREEEIEEVEDVAGRQLQIRKWMWVYVFRVEPELLHDVSPWMKKSYEPSLKLTLYHLLLGVQ